MSKEKTVDEYIKTVPAKHRPILKQLRKIIKSAAPKSDEHISYGMPYYGYKGRLAYFRLAKNHLGLYIPPPVINEHKKELKDYYASKATIHLPLDKNLPTALIRKLILAAVKKNESKKA